MSHRRSDSSAGPSSRNDNRRSEVPQNKDESESSSIVQRKLVKMIAVESTISSVVLLADGQRFVSGDKNGKLQHWRKEDGKEVGTPGFAGSAVRCLAASQGGKWIVVGTEEGVFVWDVESWEELIRFTCKTGVNSVDISSDGMKIAIAWDDKSVEVYSLPDGAWLRGWQDCDFHTVKFSPDGLLFACGSEYRESSVLRIHHSQDGLHVGDIYISTRSIAWAGDSKKLFALSSDGNIHCVDVSNRKTLSKWPIHNTDNPRCISLSTNGAFIAAAANGSVSFWDTATHEQISTVIYHPHYVNSMAISPNDDLVIAGNSTIALWDLPNFLSAPNNQKRRATGFQILETSFKDTITKLGSRLSLGQWSGRQKEDALDKTTNSPSAESEAQNAKSMDLEKTVEELGKKLASSQKRHGEEIKNLEITVQQLRAQLSDSQQNAKESRAELSGHQRKLANELKVTETTIRQLRTQLSDSQQNAKESRTELSDHQRKHGEEIKNLEITIQQLHTQLSDSQRNARESRTELSIHQWKHGEQIKHLETTIQQLHTQLSDSQQNAKESRTELSIHQWKHGEEIKNLEITIQQLRTQLSDSQQNAKECHTELSSHQRKCANEIKNMETTIQQLRTQLSDNAEKYSTELSNYQRDYGTEMKNMETTIQQLRGQLSNTEKSSTELSNYQREHGTEMKNMETIIQQLRTQLSDNAKKYNTELSNYQRDHGTEMKNMETTIQQLRTELSNHQRDHGDDMKNLETTIWQLRTQLSDAQRSTKTSSTELLSSQQVIRAHRQKHQCESLYADGHVINAAKSLLDIKMFITDDVKSDAIIVDWLSVFTAKCVAALEQIGDNASQTRNDGDALAAYAAALSLSPSAPNTILDKWISTTLLHGSTNEILDGAQKLRLPKVAVYRVTCDVLEGDGRVTEAVECFGEMRSELAQDNDVGNQRAQWELDFQGRCTKRLEKLADAAFDSQNYDEADKHFSTILLLGQPDCAHTLIKRSRTRVMMNKWEDALKDADEAIKFDPTSHRGHECRHAALHGARRHAEAVSAFDMMLSKLAKSHNPRVRALRSQYQDARRTIRSIIQATTSQMPRVLIDTTTGRLCDRAQQAKAFETLPIFDELVSSMTREIDHAWIRREVNEFCGYVMFSHKWEPGEPLFQKVMHVTVYKLGASRGNIKLRTFCSIVRALGFRWAWSDTCCIDKSDNVVLQESLVAMFAWYRDSSLTIIHLLGVSSLSDMPDALRESIWNSRVWTYQEYVAAKRVLFYTEDWKPYLGLMLENHKQSPVILREMEMSEVSSEQVAILQPGLDRIREKLYLASTRETTLVEDAAYSLLGILNASIPVIYGEGTRAVGRLLEYVLTGSGDATILAWTGIANDYNSCLPVNLAVYKTVVPPHIPQMETAELDCTVAELRSALPNISLAAALYDELNKLPPPTVASSRLRLPGIVSPITDITISELDPQTYRAATALFGDVEVKTTSDLAPMKGLCLVHPWIRPLLDQEFTRGSIELDLTTQALRLIVRLQQPFGALLFEQVSRTEYKRVAADSLIMVQFGKEVSLTDLTSNIRTIEVL